MHIEDDIYVVGAGGHGKVVVDALLAAGADRDSIRVLDGDPARVGEKLLGIPVELLVLADLPSGVLFHIAIGSGVTRGRLFAEFERTGMRALSIVHPAATVAASARMAEGVFIAANAVVGPDVELSTGVIVNHGAVVDHDCCVGAFAHVAPNATLAGEVRIGAQVLIGAGANVLPGVSIDEDAIVGAGAVVLNNVLAGQTWAGVPASSISKG